MKHEEIIEKIKKLLRMQRGGSEGEIANALRLAQDLADKHGINLDGVNPDEEPARPIGHEDALQSGQIRFEAKYAGMVCQQFFRVEVFTRRIAWNRFALTFVGTDWDREIARYVFDFLSGHFRRSWRAAQKARLRNRQAFLWGMYLGLCHKLKAQQPAVEPDALALMTTQGVARREYIAREFGELESNSVKPDGDAKAATWAGIIAGRRTEIRPAVPGGEHTERLLQ
jgi:hypothetical protein